MEMIIGSARNIMFAEHEGEVKVGIEVIVITSETDYKYDGASVAQYDKAGHVRFSGSAKALRQLSKRLEEFAAEADALEKRVEVQP